MIFLYKKQLLVCFFYRNSHDFSLQKTSVSVCFFTVTFYRTCYIQLLQQQVMCYQWTILSTLLK